MTPETPPLASRADLVARLQTYIASISGTGATDLKVGVRMCADAMGEALSIIEEDGKQIAGLEADVTDDELRNHRLESENARLREQVGRLREALAEVRVVLALSDGEGRRAKGIHAPEDAEVALICERVGYGAVMDAAARLWFLKDSTGAHTTGASASTVRSTRTLIDAALATAPAKQEDKGNGE